jgi:hypothetical protein
METAGPAERSVVVAPWRALYATLAAAAAVLPWIPRWVPTQDGPQQVRLTEFLIEMRGDAASPLHAVYHDTLGLVTGSIFAWWSLLAHPVLSVETAEKLWLSLCIGGFAWVGWLVTRAASPGAPARALLLAPLFVNGFTTSGFYPYLASVPLAVGGVLLLAPTKRMGHAALASILLMLAALGHVSSLAVAIGLVVLGLVWRRSGWREMVRPAVAFVPSLLVVAHSARVLAVGVSAHQSPMSEVVETRSPFETVVHFFTYVTAGVGPFDSAVQATLLVLVLALLGVGVAKLLRRRAGLVEVQVPVSAWPLAVVVLLGIVLMVLPTRVGAWSHASARVIPFILLLLPAAVWWPAPGSALERRLASGLAAGALVVVLGVGYGWRRMGEHLDQVAKAASVIAPGSRVVPLVFEPGPEASWSVREARGTIGLHAWAIPTRLRDAMVSFGFENMRRLMIVARADAQPSFPPGPDEFAARILWASSEPVGVRVFADQGLSQDDITDDARFLLPRIADARFYDELRNALLDHAFAEFHYLLAIDPPQSFLGAAQDRGWHRLYESDGVYVYRLGKDLGVDRLAY